MVTVARTGKALAATAALAVVGTAMASAGGNARRPDAVHAATPQTAADPNATGFGTTAVAGADVQPSRHGTIVRKGQPVGVVVPERAKGAASSPHGSTASNRPSAIAVAGGIVTVPTGAPTSADPSTFDFKGLCTEEWTGDWTGVSVCNVTRAHYDVATGELTAAIVDTFTGTYAADHSTGTLTFDETFEGNVVNGSGVVAGRIVASDGDPTFRCSSGTVTMPVYFNPVFGYGGYTGSWRHGCGGTTANV